MRKWLLIAAALAAGTLLAGCSKTPEQPTEPAGQQPQATEHQDDGQYLDDEEQIASYKQRLRGALVGRLLIETVQRTNILHGEEREQVLSSATKGTLALLESCKRSAASNPAVKARASELAEQVQAEVTAETTRATNAEEALQQVARWTTEFNVTLKLITKAE